MKATGEIPWDEVVPGSDGPITHELVTPLRAHPGVASEKLIRFFEKILRWSESDEPPVLTEPFLEGLTNLSNRSEQ
jgi:hypothetical protein